MALKKIFLSSPEQFNENHTGLKLLGLLYGNLNRNILIVLWFQTTWAKITDKNSWVLELVNILTVIL